MKKNQSIQEYHEGLEAIEATDCNLQKATSILKKTQDHIAQTYVEYLANVFQHFPPEAPYEEENIISYLKAKGEIVRDTESKSEKNRVLT